MLKVNGICRIQSFMNFEGQNSYLSSRKEFLSMDLQKLNEYQRLVIQSYINLFDYRTASCS